ncbi:hypothetical protein FISHEDRAFT_70469 [Fistulina hepatica ATCC 64428]|uniref:Uncharacterized protein n=1 Tax=Fistulina hepatica ATCC 64428 TaxID=1128425 RepID=A0A0D7AJJ6_9AGAR|nr:hypothetical protein FISHEDRAFT_70469 [Fistulina hepatica ATCC 64428]
MNKLYEWACENKGVTSDYWDDGLGDAYEALLVHTGLVQRHLLTGLTVIFNRDGSKMMHCIYLQCEDQAEGMLTLPPWKSYARLRHFLGYDGQLPKWYENDPFEAGLLKEEDVKHFDPKLDPTQYPQSQHKAAVALSNPIASSAAAGEKRAISETDCAHEVTLAPKKARSRRAVIPPTDRKTRSVSKREDAARVESALVTPPTSDSSRGDEYVPHGYRVYVDSPFTFIVLPTVNSDSHFAKALNSIIRKNPSSHAARLVALQDELRRQRPDAKFDLAGFCEGDLFAINQNSKFDATLAAHPSLVSYPGELDCVTKPFSLAVAGSDKNYNGDRARDTVARLR